jgi:hypothetical protein
MVKTRIRFFIRDYMTDSYFRGIDEGTERQDDVAQFGCINDDLWFSYERDVAEEKLRVLRADFSQSFLNLVEVEVAAHG